MKAFERQEGVAFIIIYYSEKNELYYMRFRELLEFWERAGNGGRKSIRYEELDVRFFMKVEKGYQVPYLNMINLDLEIREASA